MTQLVPDIRGADPTAAGLLIECRGQDAETLKVRSCKSDSSACTEESRRGCRPSKPKNSACACVRVILVSWSPQQP